MNDDRSHMYAIKGAMSRPGEIWDVLPPLFRFSHASLKIAEDLI